jgi:hypothetical protein
MLSTFESALLDRHLHGCAACRAFATDADEQTQMLRAAVLEQPARRVVLSSDPARSMPGRVGGVLSACLVAAAAAAVLVWPGGGTQQKSGQAESAIRTGAPVIVVVPAELSSSVNVVVPRLSLRPASIADGPLHGYFSTPV